MRKKEVMDTIISKHRKKTLCVIYSFFYLLVYYTKNVFQLTESFKAFNING